MCLSHQVLIVILLLSKLVAERMMTSQVSHGWTDARREMSQRLLEHM